MASSPTVDRLDSDQFVSWNFNGLSNIEQQKYLVIIITERIPPE